IVSGQNTTSVLIYFPVTPSTITVGVVATNASGSSAIRSVGVHGKPAVPGLIVATPSDWCAGTNGIQFFSDVSALTGVYSLQWSWSPVPAAGNASGLTSNLLTLDWLAQTTHGVVRLVATNSCGTGIRYYTTAVTCGPNPNRETNDNLSLDMDIPVNTLVYPNPTQGNISLKINSEDESAYNIKIVDVAGRIILDEEVNAIVGENEFSFDLTNAAKGIYSVLINGNNISEVNRISLQ
ncbi:MAG: T9SS type A sorting domain-containing protein, partial [Bacteroidota bacterium]